MLEKINTILSESLGPFGPLLAIGILGMFLILLTLPILLKKNVDPLDKLKDQARAASPSTDKGKLLRGSSKKDKLEKYSNFLEPQDAEQFSAIKLKLLQAGYRSKTAVRTFYFIQFALGTLLLLVGVVLALVQSATGDPSTKMVILTIMGPGLVGYICLSTG